MLSSSPTPRPLESTVVRSSPDRVSNHVYSTETRPTSSSKTATVLYAHKPPPTSPTISPAGNLLNHGPGSSPKLYSVRSTELEPPVALKPFRLPYQKRHSPCGRQATCAEPLDDSLTSLVIAIKVPSQARCFKARDVPFLAPPSLTLETFRCSLMSRASKESFQGFSSWHLGK